MEPPKTLKEMLKRLIYKEKIGETAKDELTNKPFELWTEAIWDTLAAAFSVLYLLVMLIFWCWVLFDIYHGQNQVLTFFFSEDTIYPDSPLSRLIAYAVIGGGLGGVVNGFRSIINWHSERMAFGWRFIWKYITLPPLGAVLAAIVYAVVRCGIGVLGGGFDQGENSANQVLSAFAIGALSGYGSHQVFKWLDENVKKIFTTTKVKVPDLTGKTQKEAEAALKEANLKLGKVSTQVSDDPAIAGKVISQNPIAGSISPKGKSVDITIATTAP